MTASQADTSFVDALRYGSTLILARFTVYTDGIAVGQPYLAAVSIGTFTLDRNSEQRRTGEITVELTPTVPPPLLLATNPSSLLAPFGNEVFVECGISTTGTTNIAWTPLGIYPIATSTADDTSVDLELTLNLYDRSWTIAQRALKQPYNFPATESGNLILEIQALLNQVWAQDAAMAPLVFAMTPTTQIVPASSYNQGSDPWQACLDMAAACGYELFFDINGICVAQPITDPFSTAVSWNFTDDETAILGYSGTGSASLLGSPYSTPVECEVEMTRDGIFNDIVVQGTGDANSTSYTGTGLETEQQPSLAEQADNNPLSPTWVGGAMGDVPNFVTTSLTTQPGAQALADSDLQVALSSSWQITLSIPPNPSFDVDDVVTVTRPRLGLNTVPMVLDTITVVFSYDDLCQMTGRVLGQSFYEGN